MSARNAAAGAFGKATRPDAEVCGFWHTKRGRRMLRMMRRASKGPSTTVADLTGGVCNGIAGLWLGGAVSTATRTG